jgi:uncharacterized protein YPO0396
MDQALQILLTYGPGGVIAALLVLGVLVPSKYYDREIKRGDNATEAATHNAEALREVTTALKVTTETISGVRDALKTLRFDTTESTKALREELKTLRTELSTLRRGQ